MTCLVNQYPITYKLHHYGKIKIIGSKVQVSVCRKIHLYIQHTRYFTDNGFFCTRQISNRREYS